MEHLSISAVIVYTISSILSLSSGNIINTNSTNQYRSKRINCNENEDCTVICDESYSCYNASIYCPTNYACSINCLVDSTPSTYDNICNLAHFHCPDNGQCDIICNGQCESATFYWPTTYPFNTTYSLTCHGDSSCYNTLIEAPNNNDFTFNCSGPDVCRSSNFICPQNHNCNILCNGDSSCYSSVIDWSYNSIQNTLLCNGDYSCRYLKPLIPLNAYPLSTVIVTCYGIRSCQGIVFPIPVHNEDYQLICDEDFKCAASYIYCPLNANCNIICSSYYACYDTTIFWSQNQLVSSLLTCTNSGCYQTTKPPIFSINNDEDFYYICNSHECYGSIIYCPMNAECHITCNGEYACYGVTFNWPYNHPYSLSCESAKYSCSEIIYTPYDNNQPLIINCSARSMCQNSIFNCPLNSYCEITCNGDDSCYGSIFNGYGKIISCVGDAACANIIFPIIPIYMQQDYSLVCRGYWGCANSIIYCPQATNTKCNITCHETDQEDPCAGSTVLWPTNINNAMIYPINYTGQSINPPPTHIYYINENEDFYLNCSSYAECAGAIIHCPLNAQCHIICHASYSCNGAIFNWIEDQQYSLTCGNVEASCKSVIIPPYINYNLNNIYNNFNLTCGARGMCSDSIINCPLYGSCNIICTGGHSSCNNAVINGPIGYPLTVLCDGMDYACASMKIYAQKASQFILKDCSYQYTCYDIQIWVPHNPANKSMFILNYPAVNIQNIKIYSINGWNDVTVVDYSNSYLRDYVGVMYCSPNFDIMCHISRYEWLCNIYGDTTCNNASFTTTTQPPTTLTSSPTISPTVIDDDSTTKIIQQTNDLADNSNQIKYVKKNLLYFGVFLVFYLYF
eukprot:471018_1